jgi:hypothetical protein
MTQPSASQKIVYEVHYLRVLIGATHTGSALNLLERLGVMRKDWAAFQVALKTGSRGIALQKKKSTCATRS